ncbi:hypothetical protein PSAR109036_05870 [Psychrobacter arenosus]|uniref:hypothetical protein n=1 Tax=Psychrobacter arenosus TaxID=256326 RepID=UPI0019180472|nr:hypothetical protein [Psychrobacter arenosus]
MSLRLVFDPTLTAMDKSLCQAYWAFDNTTDYIQYVKTLCQQYGVSTQALFDKLTHCYVCLDDVCCQHCGTYCAIEVPADIPYRRAHGSWSCDVCEYAIWRHEFSK